MGSRCQDVSMESLDVAAGRPYGGASALDRVAERRRRLTESALDLVGEDGVEGLTIGGICRRAALAKRYFYEGFDSLDELLGQTLADALDRVSREIAATSAARDGGSIESLQEVAIEAVLGTFEDHRLARLYLESPGNAALRAARDRAVAGFVGQFLHLLAVDDAHWESARLHVHVVVAGTTDVVAMWLRGELDLEREELVRHLVALGSATTSLIRET